MENSKKNSGICHPVWGQPLPLFSKTRSISANYEPFSTKLSEISAPTRWQRIGKKMLKNTAPLGAAPPPHILKYCQLLDISGNYERISMKFSGISPLARRKKMGKNNTKIYHPPTTAPAAPTPQFSNTR